MNDLRKLVSLRWNKIYEGHLTWFVERGRDTKRGLFYDFHCVWFETVVSRGCKGGRRICGLAKEGQFLGNGLCVVREVHFEGNWLFFCGLVVL